MKHNDEEQKRKAHNKLKNAAKEVTYHAPSTLISPGPKTTFRQVHRQTTICIK
jgi:hypothetical protein